MSVLISGAKSGLGRHLHETLGGMAWTREMPEADARAIAAAGVDTIVHCAFNSTASHRVAASTLYPYLADTVLLTQRLLAIPHRRFVYVSTVDVYPKTLPVCREDMDFPLDEVAGTYGITKLISEALVREGSPDPLILRSTGLLGRHARRNSLIRIAEDEPCALTLDGKSRFNYVLHEDVSDFIVFAIREDLRGVFNLACRGSVALEDIARWLGRDVAFGDHHYTVGNIDNSKIAALFPAFSRPSEAVAREFLARRLAESAGAPPPG